MNTPIAFGRRDLLRDTIRESSRPSAVFWLMNALATIIACYGLLSNSGAVIIGAMVVAMLLGPIAGVALALTDADSALLKTALLCLVGGILWIVFVAVVIGTIHRDAALTAEIIARTSPSLFDLIIALAGGAAGAIATVSPRVGTAIVGVAIATALVPPLAATGLLLARGDLELAWNALVLALTNVVAIQFTFSVVLWFNGFRSLARVKGRDVVEFLRHDFVHISILCALSVVLGIRLHHVVTTTLFEERVRNILKMQAERLPGSYVETVSFQQQMGRDLVRAVVRGPDPPSAEQVAAMQAALPPAPDGGAVELRVRFVRVAIVTAHGLLPLAERDALE